MQSIYTKAVILVNLKLKNYAALQIVAEQLDKGDTIAQLLSGFSKEPKPL